MAQKGLELGTNAGPPHPAAWRAQRVGWWLLGMFVIAAALGVFGDGPVSKRRVTAADGQLTFEYERFVRIDAPAQMRVDVPPAVGARDVELWLAREYLQHIEIETMTPQPLETTSAPAALYYRFRVTEGGGAIAFNYKARKAGPLHATIGLKGTPGIRFAQWVYP